MCDGRIEQGQNNKRNNHHNTVRGASCPTFLKNCSYSFSLYLWAFEMNSAILNAHWTSGGISIGGHPPIINVPVYTQPVKCGIKFWQTEQTRLSLLLLLSEGSELQNVMGEQHWRWPCSLTSFEETIIQYKKANKTLPSKRKHREYIRPVGVCRSFVICKGQKPVLGYLNCS